MPAPPMDIFDQISQPGLDFQKICKKEICQMGVITYSIVWYDQTYPYGEYTGYQEYLPTLLVGVPMKIENNYTAALKQLSKFTSNSKFIVVATGKKKKQLIKEIHENAAIEKIYIIKPFVEKVRKWGNAYSKLKVVSEFKYLYQELKDLVKVYIPSGYKYTFAEKLLNYAVVPDPMIMNEQCVRALKDEIAQEEDQSRFKYNYSIILQTMKTYYEDELSKFRTTKDNSHLMNPLNSLLRKYNGDEQLAEAWLNLIELASYLDECQYLLAGATINDLQIPVMKGSIFSDQSARELFSLVKVLTKNIKEKKLINEFENKETLKKVHCMLYNAVFEFAEKQYQGIDKWRNLYMIQMLLHDIDLCLKMVIHFILQNDNSDFHFDFIHSAIVSDSRVSVLTELWDAWKKQDIPSNIRLSESKLDEALGSIRIKNIIVFHTSNVLTDFVKQLQGNYVPYQYYLVRDFLVDIEALEKLKYNFAYVLIDPAMTPSEYNKILNTCISKAITPLFILYIPPSCESLLAKAMLKTRWIVSFVYCPSFEHIQQYLNEVENNVNRDLHQYSKFYDDFKSTLGDMQPQSNSLSAESTEENDVGWEVLSSINKNIFSQLVEELSLGTKLVGSLHYYVFSEMRQQNRENDYWENYAPLFGISNKYTSILDVNCSKTILRAYTLQTNPPFYKMLNDAFRGGNPEKIAKYRAFFSMLHDLVRKGIMKKHIGFVYRGTYFNPGLIETLKSGTKVFSSCFTSTSKNQVVARNFAKKTKRNVLLEIELNIHANSNVDIHSEQCSRYPEEEEVLLLPFASFEIQRVFKEDNLTVISLKELVPEFETINLKGIEYYN